MHIYRYSILIYLSMRNFHNSKSIIFFNCNFYTTRIFFIIKINTNTIIYFYCIQHFFKLSNLQKAKAGKRMAGSDSEYSYRSVVSAGGTRHVKRKHKRADGTYSDSESYHSSADEEGAARRRRRRRDRKHAGSAHSYFR